MLYDKKWDQKVKPALEPWRVGLLRAAKTIEERGWCQGAGINAKGEVCLMGAISFNRGNLSVTKLLNYLVKKTGDVGISIPAYNDSCLRSKEEAIALLQAAAYDETQT